MRRDERFEVQRTIQDGMVATSYKARDRVLDRTVLLKVLHPRRASDQDMVERFRREAMLQARLKHPNIVTVYDFGTDEDMFIASEFIDGDTLDSILRQEGRLSVERLVPLMLQVARALEYAHGHGVVHRDLKPANIMVDRHGEVKLTDFGLAFARDLGQLTQEGSVVGTPSYMSPEQARGRKTDSRTDLFSLGIVIYQALSGTNPFAADSFADAMSLVLNRTPEPLSRLVPGLPPEIDALVTRLLAKDPTQRPDSIADIIAVFSGRAAPGRRRSSLRIIGPAVAVALVVLVAVGLMRRAPPHQPVAVVLPDSTVAAAPESSSAPESPKPGPRSPVPGSQPRASSPRPPETGPCRTRITVLPWAQVLVDGRSIGMTPLAERLVLARGPHTIELRHPNYPVFTRNVVLDDSACDLKFDLNRMFAFLDVRVSPWAAVAVDGQPVDTTPLERPVALTLGEHIITLSHPELGTRQERILTDSAKTYRLNVDLTQR